MIDSITQFDTHQAIPTQILTKCIVLVVEKLVVVKLNPPFRSEIQNFGILTWSNFNTYMTNIGLPLEFSYFFSLNNQKNTYNPLFDVLKHVKLIAIEFASEKNEHQFAYSPMFSRDHHTNLTDTSNLLHRLRPRRLNQ